MVFSNVIFDVKKMRKINRTLQKILILNSFWSLSGQSILLECHLSPFVRYQLGYNCDTNCKTNPKKLSDQSFEIENVSISIL